MEDAKDSRIHIVSAKNINPIAFTKNYLEKNEPCLITDIDLTGWRSHAEWVDCEGNPSWEFLANVFGSADVSVTYSNQASSRQGNDNPTCLDMCLSEYIELVRSNEWPNSVGQVPYVKDWHFRRDFPNYDAYKTPKYVKDDWLNMWWDQHPNLNNDYRFVYIGIAGSYTPMHHDVFMSNSWSVNICGEKEWIFVPPEDAGSLQDSLGNLVHNINGNYDAAQFPHIDNVHRFTIIQPPRSMMFVPSGWRHQVRNLKDTISINHNWFNRYNLDHVLDYLLWELERTRISISDCRTPNVPEGVVDEEWELLCQVVFKANCGMSFDQIVDLLQMKISKNQCMFADTQVATRALERIQQDPGLKSVLHYSKQTK